MEKYLLLLREQLGSISVGIALSLFFIAASVQAATAIGMNIQTDGTLGVTGQSTLTGNVGIGTTSPSQLLTVGNNNQFTVDTSGNVVGGMMKAGNVKIGNWGGNTSYEGIWLTTSTPDFTNFAFLDDNGGGTLFNSPSSGHLHFRVGNTTYMVVNSNGVSINNGATGAGTGVGLAVATGNVGIGTTSPAGKLEVVSGDLLVTNATAATGSLRIRPWNSAGTGVNFDPQADAGNFYFGRDNTLSKFVVQSGNVGVGTTTPSQALDVNGNINLEGSANGIIMHDTATASCYLVQVTNGALALSPHACK